MELLLNLFIIFIGLCSLTYLFFTKKYEYWRQNNVEHDTPKIPFGNLSSLVTGKESIGDLLARLYEKFDKPYFGIYSFWVPTIVLKDPQLIKAVLIKDFDNFKNKNFASSEKADPIIYHSILSLQGEKWKNMRTKLTPVFSSGKIKLMFSLIKECYSDLSVYLQGTTGDTVEMKETASKLTTDVISSCAFGVRANSFLSEDAEFRVSGKKIFTFTAFRAFSCLCYFFAPFLVYVFKLKFIEPTAASFLKSAFTRVLKEREENRSKPRNDLVDIMIKLKTDNPEMAMNENFLVSQAITFFSAGHESTASTISYALYELALNKTIQDKLREEIQQTMKKHGDIGYDGLNEMSYLDMVVSETLRKYPFVAFLTRKAQKDYKVPGHSLVIQKDVEVLIPLTGLHFDPKYFPEPQKFEPERFSDSKKHLLTNCTYLPFGDGPRNCIGARFGLVASKLTICMIVKDFYVLRAPDTPDKLTFLPEGPVLIPVNGVRIKFEKI